MSFKENEINAANEIHIGLDLSPVTSPIGYPTRRVLKFRVPGYGNTGYSLTELINTLFSFVDRWTLKLKQSNAKAQQEIQELQR